MYQLRLLLSDEEQAAYVEGFKTGTNWKNFYIPGGPWKNPKDWQSLINWLSWMEGFASAANNDHLFHLLHGEYEFLTECKPS